AVTAAPVLSRGQRIIFRRRIAPGRSRFLIDERLYPGPDRRTEARAAAAVATGHSGACCIAKKVTIGMAPGAVAREHRNVGQIAHAIARIAHDRLTARLGVSRAASADDIGAAEASSRASARAAAARDVCERAA